MADRRAAVVTISDSIAAGANPDVSGQVAAERLEGAGFTVVERSVVADGIDTVATELRRLAPTVDLIVTSGGTGMSPRDLTPEATLSVLDRSVPGISEAMRSATFGTVPFGMLSRGVSGLIGRCLVINLPGSPKAVAEGFDVIGDVLDHAVAIASGIHGDHR